ncbi:MAG: NUDIX hydrolase [Candidatus ainarchaeum sp.]|nr:NUDIX hydrolase [Candidatus ainarchaeum sp.]
MVDCVLIRGKDVLLVKRDREPWKGKWALPGGFMEFGETAEEAVIREAREETGMETRPVRLLGVYSSPSRDVRQTVAIAFLCAAVKNAEPKGGDDASDARWWHLSALPELAFDHGKIIRDALTKF